MISRPRLIMPSAFSPLCTSPTHHSPLGQEVSGNDHTTPSFSCARVPLLLLLAEALSYPHCHLRQQALAEGNGRSRLGGL